MSFLTTVTEELLSAQSMLGAVNTNLAAQNAGAAPATAVVAPAAADPVSIQQAAIFSTYGTTYQTQATEAQTQLERTRPTWESAPTVTATPSHQCGLGRSPKRVNAALPLPLAAPATVSSTFSQYLLGGTGNGTNPTMLGGIFGLSSNGANIGNIGVGNWASAGSDLLGHGRWWSASPPVATPSATPPLAADAAASPSQPTPMPIGGRRHGRHGRNAGGRGHGLGHPGRPVVGAAELGGRPGHPVAGTSVTPLTPSGWTGAAPQAGVGQRPWPACPAWSRARDAAPPASAHRATASSRSSCRNRWPSSRRRRRSHSTRSETRTDKGAGYRNGY